MISETFLFCVKQGKNITKFLHFPNARAHILLHLKDTMSKSVENIQNVYTKNTQHEIFTPLNLFPPNQTGQFIGVKHLAFRNETPAEES